MQIRLEGKTLMVQYNDGKSQAILDTDYKLGTPFDIEDRRRERQGRRALQRPEEGRAPAVRIGLVLEGRRVRAVERQQGRGRGLRPARSPSTRRTSRTPADPAAPLRRRLNRGGRPGQPAARAAAVTVLSSSSAVVTGPTPPGTGVSAPARPDDRRRVDVADQVAVSSGVVPTSITTAPGADVLGPEHPRTAHRRDQHVRLGSSAPAGRRSASGRSVTVASRASSSTATGLPTTRLRPTTTTRLPASSTPWSSSIRITAAAVAGAKAGSPAVSRPRLRGSRRRRPSPARCRGDLDAVHARRAAGSAG